MSVGTSTALSRPDAVRKRRPVAGMIPCMPAKPPAPSATASTAQAPTPAPAPAPTPTSDLDRFLTYRLHRIAKTSDRASAAAYQAECGLSLSEGRCLAAVGQFEPASVKDLARLANLDKANASRAADSLVARGLVSKAASVTDGRGVALSLTRPGRVLWQRVMALIERRNAEVFGCLSARERQALDRLLDRLLAHLDPDEPAG